MNLPSRLLVILLYSYNTLQAAHISLTKSASSSLITQSSLKTIADVARYYCNLALTLSQQPRFDGKGICHECKVLPLKDATDCITSRVFSYNTETILEPQEHWWIQVAGFGDSQVKTATNIPLGCGITLDEKNNATRCSFKKLETAYEDIIKKLKSGWCLSSLQDNPDILFKKPENDWYLLVKKDQPLNDEVNLIACLRAKLTTKEIIHANGLWVTQDGIKHGRTYLWVKKQRIQKFNALFQFEVENDPQEIFKYVVTK